MESIRHALLESWDRQCAIVRSVAELINTSQLEATPAEGETSIAFHLAHIHEVRWYWLSKVHKASTDGLGDLLNEKEGQYLPIMDLKEIRIQLDLSAAAVRRACEELFKDGAEAVGGYDDPVLFMQHMIWHEGWHVGLIFLALRRSGHEPSEEWEEANVWGRWRTE